jgi:hypothetical protein
VKKLLVLSLLVATGAFAASDDTIKAVYGPHVSECTTTAVASTNANLSGPFTAGKLYLIYGYTSATDFTGIGIKCLQGTSAVTVASKNGVKIPAGGTGWYFYGTGLYLSCQTGTGSGYYDVCPTP